MAMRTLTKRVRIHFVHLGSLFDREQATRFFSLTPQPTLRRASERILVSDSLLRLVRLSFDNVRHTVLGTSAVHDLLRQIVRIVDEGPRDVSKITTFGQIVGAFTQLELSGLVDDGVAIGRVEGKRAVLLIGTTTLSFCPWTVVRVHFVAYRER